MTYHRVAQRLLFGVKKKEGGRRKKEGGRRKKEGGREEERGREGGRKENEEEKEILKKMNRGEWRVKRYMWGRGAYQQISKLINQHPGLPGTTHAPA